MIDLYIYYKVFILDIPINLNMLYDLIAIYVSHEIAKRKKERMGMMKAGGQDLQNNCKYRRTPLMGWASWNCFRTNISEDKIKQQADALVSTGLAESGYTYLNMDDGFFGGRAENGQLLFHKERFPNGIKVIADYAHKRGLKAGIYSEAGDNTCGHYYDHEGYNGQNVGLYMHEEQDLSLYFEACGFDFIKVDWCGALRLGLDEKTQYTKIGNIIDNLRRKLNKPLVYNVCRWQFPGEWVTEIADSWRTGADITPDFDSVMHQLDVIKPLYRYCTPGHVNDLDMMQIGNGLSREEEITHFVMWCMMSTPLMLGCDLTILKEETLELLKNNELIAVNQDRACLQAFVVDCCKDKEGKIISEVWVKDLGEKDSCTKAIALLNRSEEEITIKVGLENVGIAGEILRVRDLLTHEDIFVETFVKSGEIKGRVMPHGVKIYRIESEKAIAIKNPDDLGKWKCKRYSVINQEQLTELRKQGAILVDVRTPEEFNVKHMCGAINIPYTIIHAVAKALIPDKKVPVILYCTTGKRSRQAKESLECLGYEHVYVSLF